MQRDRGRLLYHCINADTHTVTLNMDALNHGRDFTACLKPLFALRILDVWRLSRHDGRDGLQLRLGSLRETLKVKMRLVQNERDYDMMRDQIESLRGEIRDCELKLTEMDMVDDRDGLCRDFHLAMQDAVPESHWVARYVAETFREIVADRERLTVVLWDGNSFDLPRIPIDRRGSMLVPWGDVNLDCDGEDLGRVGHITVSFFCGEWSPGLEGSETLLETENYTILLYR